LADRCADILTRSTIAKIESGVRQALTVDEASALARAFEITDSELLAPASPIEELVDAITSLRRKAGLTPRQLANLTPITAHEINEIDLAETLPEWKTVQTLVEALDGDVDRLRAIWQRASSTTPGSARPSSDTVRVPPQQLPPATRSFVGRTNELAALDRALRDASGPGHGATICTISGIGGIGKTALAINWANLARHHFPDGCLYADLRGADPDRTISHDDVLRQFLIGLGIPPSAITPDTNSMIGLYRSVVADRRLLVVLDDARDAADVAALLPTGDRCVALITSRTRMSTMSSDYGATDITLSELSGADSETLLRTQIGDKVESDPSDISQLAALCAGLPLALNAIGAMASTGLYSVADLIALLHEEENRLSLFDLGDYSLRAALTTSYEALPRNAGRLLRLLALLPGSRFDRYLAASVLGVRVQAVTPMLRVLLQAHLIETTTPGRFHMHELIRVFAKELALQEESEASVKMATNRALDYLIHTAADADRNLDAFWEPIELEPPIDGVAYREISDQDVASQWFHDEIEMLIASIHLAAARGFGDHAWKLAVFVTTYLYREVQWRKWTDVLIVALDLTRSLGNPEAEARVYRILGTAYARLRAFDEAQEMQTEALRLFRQLGDINSEAHTLLMLSRNYNWHGDYPAALERSAEALALYRSIDHPGQARAMIDLGRSHAHLREHADALELAQQALSLCQVSSDRDGECSAWALLGDVHFGAGSFIEAISAYEQALALWRSIGDQIQEAETLVRLADSFQASGNTASAEAARCDARKLLEKIGLPQDAQQHLRWNS
jgi:tetratricopeptide (TPR) repeat protein/transcriptional regulator with XRE-family HTH domain